jgi:TatD DNase family protein
MLFDTHCHLDIDRFDDDRADVLQRAREAGVSMMLNPAFDLASSRRAIALAQVNDDIVAAVGIHPNDAGGFSDATLVELRTMIDAVRENSQRKIVVAIGEIGLDYHWETVPSDMQSAAFVAQLDFARELDLAVIVHCRDAYDDTLEILRRHGRDLSLVMHSFLSNTDHLRAILELGYSIGLGGPVTYPSAKDLRDMVKTAPLQRILIETDAPYLAPQAHRGRRNEPAYVRFVAEKIAEVQGVTMDEVAQVTQQNARTLFGLSS